MVCRVLGRLWAHTRSQLRGQERQRAGWAGHSWRWHPSSLKTVGAAFQSGGVEVLRPRSGYQPGRLTGQQWPCGCSVLGRRSLTGRELGFSAVNRPVRTPERRDGHRGAGAEAGHPPCGGGELPGVPLGRDRSGLPCGAGPLAAAPPSSQSRQRRPPGTVTGEQGHREERPLAQGTQKTAVTTDA